MKEVGVGCNKTSLNISRELVLLIDVVPGGVYFVVDGLCEHIGNLMVCVWIVKVVYICHSIYFTCYDVKFCSFIAG